MSHRKAYPEAMPLSELTVERLDEFESRYSDPPAQDTAICRALAQIARSWLTARDANPQINYMDLDEFRDLGYLQEVNRQFFHPLGLALVWNEDDDGTITLSGVWDDRDDPEGWYMETSKRDERGAEEARKAAFIAAEREKRVEARMRAFGWVVQPVDEGGMVAPTGTAGIA